MTAPVDLVNRALSAIGARSTVANLELEQSVEAKQGRLLYAPTRDAMLRAAHWNFARKTAALSMLKAAPGTPEATGSGPWDPATMPAPPWLYEYAYPADCLLVRYVSPAPLDAGSSITPPLFSSGGGHEAPVLMGRAVPFVVASSIDNSSLPIRVVLANARAALGTYTARIEAPELWDDGFQEALVSALASRFSVALTGNLELAQRAAQQAMQALFTARAQDGNEGLTRLDHVPDWLAARGVSLSRYESAAVAPWVTPTFLVV